MHPDEVSIGRGVAILHDIGAQPSDVRIIRDTFGEVMQVRTQDGAWVNMILEQDQMLADVKAFLQSSAQSSVPSADKVPEG